MKWKVAAVVLLLAVGLGTAGYVVIAPGRECRAVGRPRRHGRQRHGRPVEKA
jgi:hypothetical protein